jgi:hypothetical protein
VVALPIQSVLVTSVAETQESHHDDRTPDVDATPTENHDKVKPEMTGSHKKRESTAKGHQADECSDLEKHWE